MRAKKICVLAYLSMALTVGAVYATWNYATGSITPVTIDNIGVGITSATTVAKGNLKTTTSDISLTIENDGNYKPIIAWKDSGGATIMNNKALINVGFAPDTSYKNTYINLMATVSFSGNTWTYGGTTNKIFAVTSGIDFSINWTSGSSNSTAGTGDYSGYYVIELDVVELFKLEDTIIDTYDKYEAYKLGLDSTLATITISDNS